MGINGLTNLQKLNFYKNQELVEKIILRDAYHDKHIIYGAKAINAQLPKFLNKDTDDFDIFSKSPKQDALETEKKLDKAYGGDFFRIEKAEYPNTWKVKNNVTGKTTADYTFPNNKKIPNKIINGNKYAKLNWIKKQIKRSLNNKNNAFRFEKDKEALQRINLYQRNKEFIFG